MANLKIINIDLLQRFWDGFKDKIHIHKNINILDSITANYTVEEKNKLNNIENNANKYTHPLYTSKSNGLYKMTIDKTGHVSNTTPVTKSDITLLGIPEINTTYSNLSEFNNDVGYLTKHQDISGKVDKVSGKSLISDAEITRLASVKNYNDISVKERISTLENAGYITKAVSDLTNYYKKSEIYTQIEVNKLISAIPKFTISVVESLPTSNISSTIIYLLKTSTTETGNLYTEYIYVNNTWEKLGTQTLDLSGYATTSVVSTGLNGKVDKISGKGLSTNDLTSVLKGNYDAAYTHSTSTHARTDATNVKASTTNGNIIINEIETKVYTHPSGTNPHGTTKNDVGLGNVGNFKAVSTVASQGLTDTEKSNARVNIGAQVAGSYASSTHNHDDKYQVKGSYASASHNHDDRYYTETEINTKLNSKANSSHTHGNGDITSLDASKITSGTISIDRLPQGALERLTIVADDTARFKLTSSTVQKGDTVKVTATGKMYYVVDETKLSSEAGYEVYAAGTAASVPWSGVTGKPSTYAPSSHTHTKSQITDFPTSMPASDVFAWAKASTKPSYTKFEVGLGNVDNTADSAKSVKYATSAGSATNASKVNNHTVESDVPANAKFTDTNTWRPTETILSNANLNTITTPGFYNAGGGNNCTNKPSNVDHFGMIVIHRASGSYYTQIIFNDTSSWRRFCVNGSWKAWIQDKYTDTTYSVATTSANGLMSKDMVTKLNGIASGATKITVDGTLSSTSNNPISNSAVCKKIAELEKAIKTLNTPTYYIK